MSGQMAGSSQLMWRLGALALAAAALALLALATAGLLSSAAEAEPSAQASKARLTLNIRNFAYSKSTVRISRGDKVVFANKERGVSHTATANNGSFDTGTIGPGKQATIAFNRKGTFRFHCEIHPSMRAKVVVQ